MAFFDKLSEMAKNIGDKTNDAIETTKLNSKINGEKKAIEAEMSKLGACVYAMHTAGSPFEGEAAEICSVIDEHNRAIAEIQAEIERIKAEAEAAQAARAAASAKAASQAAQAAVQASDAAQAAAQAATAPGALPQDAPAADAGRACPSCSASVPGGVKFCPECGTKMPEPAPARFCLKCGVKLSDTAKFCPSCGAKAE